MYTWGIFLAYIRLWLSSQLRFHVFWEAGGDRVFLVSEPGLLKENLVLIGNLKQLIFTLQYTYLIHYDISPLVNWSSSLLESIFWIFDVPEYISFFQSNLDSILILILLPSSIFLILSPEFDHSMLKSIAEIRERSGSMVNLWCSKKRHESFIFLP